MRLIIEICSRFNHFFRSKAELLFSNRRCISGFESNNLKSGPPSDAGLLLNKVFASPTRPYSQGLGILVYQRKMLTGYPVQHSCHLILLPTPIKYIRREKPHFP